MERLLTKLGAARKFILFGVVGGFGTVLNTAILYALTHFAGLYYLIAAAIATETAIVSNFVGNHLLTFRHDRDDTPLGRRFLSFQAISLITLVGTLIILYALTTLLGERLLLVWNLIAILLMFVANFLLNRKFTWKAKTEAAQKQRHNQPKATTSAKLFILPLLALFLASLTLPASSALVSVSQMGYHPNSVKTVSVFTHYPTGTFVIYNGATPVHNGTLVQATDLGGSPVKCQGGNPCLIGDFSNFNVTGTYTITATTNITETSYSFTISPAIFKDNIGVFNEFFNAEQQQGSSYHASFNGFLDPAFPQMADGSYIMTAHQAAATMIRIGDAYRRDQQLFDNDIIGTMQSYAHYLEGLQDAVIVNDPNGFRLGQTYTPENAFVPGPTNLTTVAIYDSGGKYVQNLTVTSLCGTLNNTACISNAKNIYKCQPDETCLNMTYTGSRGRHAENNGGPTVAGGWYYEWGCYPDMDLQNGNFNTQINPCMIYDTVRTYDNTAITLSAYTEVIPAINTIDPAAAQELLSRAIITQQYLRTNYNPGDSDAAGFYGAASFLLYDMTGNNQYLQDAYGVRNDVSQQLVSDRVYGNEFYWQEYIRHNDTIVQNGLVYLLAGNKDPAAIFGGQIIGDYWNGGDPVKISESAERVYQLYRDDGFSNSRNQLAESIMASKAIDLGNAPPYAAEVADQQIAWLTGNNGVEVNAQPSNINLTSLSFIFGIGTVFPTQFHSRLLMTTGYNTATGGAVIGMHDTGFQFNDSTTGQLFGLDGISNIVGYTFGGHGNLWHNETQTEWLQPQTFNNQKSYIPGWINGAFLWDKAYHPWDPSTNYNYNDDRHAYEFSETENDMVGTAIDAFAYEDARLNNVAPLPTPFLNNTGNMTGNATLNATLAFSITPANITANTTISINGTPVGTAAQNYSLASGTYVVNATSPGYGPNGTVVPLSSNVTTIVSLTLYPVPTNGTNSTVNFTLTVLSTPAGSLTINGTGYGTTPQAVPLPAGAYLVSVSATNYTTNTMPVTLASNKTLNFTLSPANGTNLTIVGSGTDLTQEQNSTAYHLFEIDTGGFWVNLSAPATVQWFVDGNLIQDGTNTSFSWSPGFLWVPRAPNNFNSQQFPVTAVTPAGNVTWTVDVEDVINPYFINETDSASVIVDVLVNSLRMNFTQVNVTFVNGATQLTYPLANNLNPNDTRLLWETTATDLPYGTSYLRTITGFNGVTNTTTIFTLGNDRGHYRSAPGGNGGNSGGGGGSVGYGPATLQLVYVTLSKDVIGIQDSVNVTLDAKSPNGVVAGVEAEFATPKGTTRHEQLTMVKGDGTYGTWTTTIHASFVPGLYTLASVILMDGAGNPTMVNVTGRSFYVTGDGSAFATADALPTLDLIYTVLNTSTLENGSSTTLKLDARDSVGVSTVTAVITDSSGGSKTLQLHRVAGTPEYGTWIGIINATQPDTTYLVSKVTLSNGNESKEYPITDRSFYVQALPPVENGMGLVTGAATQFSAFSRDAIARMLEQPLVPVLTGFGIMVIVLGALYLNFRMRKLQGTNER